MNIFFNVHALNLLKNQPLLKNKKRLPKYQNNIYKFKFSCTNF